MVLNFTDLIDIRSDTMTKPGPEMLQAMINAEVGDDVFEEDPTVKALEHKAAELLGMEAGLYCPTSTMSNQIAIRILTRPQDEMICDKLSHIYLFEAGGIAANSQVSVRLLEGERGILNPEMIEENISIDDVHLPYTTLVSLENTMNKGGGSFYKLDQIKDINKICNEHEMSLHLDGARLFNATIATGDNPSEYGKYFDTISICLSKGLGAPVGALLLSTHQAIKRARKVRKSFGGGMRQAGYIAAAGIYALDNNINRLNDDHRRAQILADTLLGKPYIKKLLPVDTNIVIFTLSDNLTTTKFIEEMANHQIKVGAFGKNDIRFVTHLDFDDNMLDKVVAALNRVRF